METLRGGSTARIGFVLLMAPCAIVAMVRLPLPSFLASALLLGVLAVLSDLGRQPRYATVPFFFLGACAPLVSVVGPGTLLPLLLAAVVLWSRDLTLGRVAWAIPFLGVAGCQVAAEAVTWARGHSLPVFVLRLGGDGLDLLGRELAQLWVKPPHLLLAVLDLARLAAIPALVAILWADPERVAALRRGVVSALVPAGVVTGLVLLVPVRGLGNQSDYWAGLGRASGTFTDPNAFGVFIVLMLPVLLAGAWSATGAARMVRLAVALLWLVLGAFSGSRTFFVGLAVGVVVAAARRGARWLAAVLLVAACAVAALNLAPVRDLVRETVEPAAPVGIVRLVGSVSLDEVDKTFQSRRIFWSIAWHAFKERPLLGIGFARFRQEAPWHALALGLELRGFTDNPNSFYLGILAEMGIAGSVALLVPLALLRRRSSVPGAWVSIVVLLVILAMGPHGEFDEVALLMAFLMAAALEPRAVVLPAKLGWAAVPVAGALVVAGLPAARGSQWGLHPPERDGRGRYFQWTTDQAEVVVRAPPGPVLSLELQDGIPGRQAPSPLLVDVLVNGRKVGTVVPPLRRWQKFSWHLPELPPGAPRRVRLVPSRPFRPALIRRRDDWRLLGVAVRNIGFGPLAPGQAHGLYPWELTGLRQCRWATSRRATIVLAGGSKVVRLRLFTLDPDAKRHPLSVAVRVAGGGATVARLPYRRIVGVQVLLPSGDDRPVIELEADRSFAARRILRGDPRELSFAIAGWAVFPPAGAGAAAGGAAP